MKKTILALLMLSICLFPLTADAITTDSNDSYESRVNYEKSTYADVLTKAKKENKLVMVDFYAPT